ncbi:hypothetical protein VTN02DRAFT_2096 [Thermoascus thermophilus]
MVSPDVTTARTRGNGSSPCAHLSPMRKKGVEHRRAFPLTTVENIRRWQRDCLGRTRPAPNEPETDIETADSCLPSTGRQNVESEAPNDTESAFEGNHSNSRELGPRPTPSVYGPKTDPSSGQTEGAVSPSISEVNVSAPWDVTRMKTRRREAYRPFYMPAEAENSDSCGTFDATSSSQSPLSRRNLAPKAPQELSSWIAAPPVKFQRQFLW